MDEYLTDDVFHKKKKKKFFKFIFSLQVMAAQIGGLARGKSEELTSNKSFLIVLPHLSRNN